MHAHTLPLRALCDALADEPDSPDALVSVSDAYTLIRLALVKRDYGLQWWHGWEAEGLHIRLTAAYRALGGYVFTSAGQRYYQGYDLRRAALRMSRV